MKELNCPKCGSTSLQLQNPAEYKCKNCGLRFMNIENMPAFVDVVLVQAGNKRTDVIRVLRNISYDEPTIKEIDPAKAARLTHSTPCVVVPNVPLEVGERLKETLEKTGARANLIPA